MTNIERIRKMSPEELARFLWALGDCGEYCPWTRYCDRCTNLTCYASPEEDCIKTGVKALQSDRVEEDMIDFDIDAREKESTTEKAMYPDVVTSNDPPFVGSWLACPKCGREVTEPYISCPRCGQKFKQR